MSAEVNSSDGSSVSFGDRLFLSNVYYFGYLYGQVRSDAKPQMTVDAHPQVLRLRQKRVDRDSRTPQAEDADTKLCRRELRHFERALIEITRPGDLGTDSTRFGSLMYGQTVRLKHVFSEMYITIHSNELPDILGSRYGTVHGEAGPSTLNAELCRDLSKEDEATSQQFRILPKYSKIRKEGDTVRIGDQVLLQHFDSGRVLASAQAEPADDDTIDEVMTSRGKSKSSVHLVALKREGTRKRDTAIWTLHGFTRRTEAAQTERAEAAAGGKEAESMMLRVGSVVSLHHVETDCFLSLVPGEVPRAKWMPDIPVPMPVWQREDGDVDGAAPAGGAPSRGGTGGGDGSASGSPTPPKRTREKSIFVEPRSEMSANFSSYRSLWIIESETTQKAKVGGGTPHGGVVMLHKPNRADAMFYRLRHLATDTYLTAEEKDDKIHLTTLEAHKLTDKNTTLVRFLPDLSVRGDDHSKAYVIGCQTLARIQFVRQRLYLHVRKKGDVTLLERYEYEDLFMLRPQPIAKAYDLSKMTEAADVLKMGTMFQPGLARQSARRKRSSNVPSLASGASTPMGSPDHSRAAAAAAAAAANPPATTTPSPPGVVVSAAGDAGGGAATSASKAAGDTATGPPGASSSTIFRGLDAATVVKACQRVLEHIERETELVITEAGARMAHEEDVEGDNLILCRQRLLLDMSIHVLCFRVLLWCKYLETHETDAAGAGGTGLDTPSAMNTSLSESPGGSLRSGTGAFASPGSSLPSTPKAVNLFPLKTLCFRLLKQLCYNDGSFKCDSTAVILYEWVPLMAYLIGGSPHHTPNGVACTETGLKLMMTILKAQPRPITEGDSSTRTLKLVLDHLVPYLTDPSRPIPKLFRDTNRLAVLACLCVSSAGASQLHHQRFLCDAIRDSHNALLYMTRMSDGRLQVYIPSGAQVAAAADRAPVPPLSLPLTGARRRVGSGSFASPARSPPGGGSMGSGATRMTIVTTEAGRSPTLLGQFGAPGGQFGVATAAYAGGGDPATTGPAVGADASCTSGGSTLRTQKSESSASTVPAPHHASLRFNSSSFRLQKASLARLGADWVDLQTFMVRWPLETTAYFAATRELMYSLAYQNPSGAEYVRSRVSVAEILHGVVLANPIWTCPWNDEAPPEFPVHHYTDPLKAAYVRICRAAYIGGHPAAAAAAAVVNPNPRFPLSPPEAPSATPSSLIDAGVRTLRRRARREPLAGCSGGEVGLLGAIEDSIEMNTSDEENDAWPVTSPPGTNAFGTHTFSTMCIASEQVEVDTASTGAAGGGDTDVEWAVPPARYRRRSAIIPTGAADAQCNFPGHDEGMDPRHHRQIKNLFHRHGLLLGMAGTSAPAFVEQLALKALGQKMELPAGEAFGGERNGLYIVASGTISCRTTSRVYRGVFFADHALMPTGGSPEAREYEVVIGAVVYHFTTSDVYTLLRRCHDATAGAIKRAMRAVASVNKFTLTRPPESTVYEYDSGDVIVEPGAPVDAAYIVLYGCVDIMLVDAEEKGWQHINAPGHFGADVVMTGAPSRFTAVANGDTAVAVVARQSILETTRGYQSQTQVAAAAAAARKKAASTTAGAGGGGGDDKSGGGSDSLGITSPKSTHGGNDTLVTVGTSADDDENGDAKSSSSSSSTTTTSSTSSLDAGRGGSTGGVASPTTPTGELPDPCKHEMWPWMRHMFVRGLKAALLNYLKENRQIDTVNVARNVLLAEWLQLLSDFLDLGVYTDAEGKELLPLLANILDPRRDKQNSRARLEIDYLFPHPLSEHTGTSAGRGGRQQSQPRRSGHRAPLHQSMGSMAETYSGRARRGSSFLGSQGLALGVTSPSGLHHPRDGTPFTASQRPSNEREIVNRVKLELCKIFTKLLARQMFKVSLRSVATCKDSRALVEQLQDILLRLMKSNGGTYDIGSRKLLVYSMRLYLLISSYREGCSITDAKARRGLVKLLREELNAFGDVHDDEAGSDTPTARKREREEKGRFLVRLIEHCRQLQQTSVSDEGLSRAEETETLVCALGCFRDVVVVPECDGDDKKYGTLQERQDKLNSLGIMRLVINTIGATQNGDESETIVKAGLDLAISLLEGGNDQVQHWLKEYFMSRRDEALFVVLRDRITRAISTLDKTVSMAEKLEGGDGSPIKARVGRRFTDPSSPASVEEAAASPVSPLFPGPLFHIKETMRFLQLCSEGHNTEMQNYFRKQADNVQSHDLVRESLKFLTSLNAVARPSRRNVMSNFCLEVATQTWDTLSEFCQGPVPDNQTTLVEGFIGRDVNKVFEIRGYGAEGPALVSAMQNAAVITVLSVCEGCTTPHIPLTLRYTLNLKLMLKEILSIPEADRAFVEFGFNVYLLLCFLKDYDCYDPSTCVSAVLDPAHPGIDATAARGLRYYKERTAQVEIMRDGHGLERVYFKKPSACLLLQRKSRKMVSASLNRDTHQSRLMDFFDRVEETMHELELLERIRRAAVPTHKRRLRSIADWKATLRGIVFHNHGKVRWVATSLVLLCNMVLLCASAPGSGYAEEWEAWCMGPPVLVNAVELPYAFALLLSCGSSLLFFHFTLEFTQFLWYEGPVLLFVADRRQQRMAGSYSVAQFLTSYRERIGTAREGILSATTTMRPWVLIHSLGREWATIRLLYSMAACFIAYFYNIFWLAVLLVPLIHESNVIRHVFTAVTRNGRSLLFTMVLGIILMYLFSVVGFVMFRDKFENADEGGMPCHTMFRCLVFTVTRGVRAGGGIGELMQPARWGSDLHALRLLYDMLFYVLITVIFMNIVFGIIVDTFGELRQKREALEQEMRTRCFICNVESSDFDKRADGFFNHIGRDHNMWNYMFFVYYLAAKPKDDLTGQESFVYNCLLNHDLKFIPVNNSLTLQQSALAQSRAAEALTEEGVGEEAREDVLAYVAPRMDTMEAKIASQMAATDESMRQIRQLVTNVARLTQKLKSSDHRHKAKDGEGGDDLWGNAKRLVLRAGSNKVLKPVKQGSSARLSRRGLRKATSAGKLKKGDGGSGGRLTPRVYARSPGSEAHPSPMAMPAMSPGASPNAHTAPSPLDGPVASPDVNPAEAIVREASERLIRRLSTNKSLGGKLPSTGLAAASAERGGGGADRERSHRLTLSPSAAAATSTSTSLRPAGQKPSTPSWRLSMSNPFAGELGGSQLTDVSQLQYSGLSYCQPDVFRPSSPETTSQASSPSGRDRDAIEHADTLGPLLVERVERRGSGGTEHTHTLERDGFVFDVVLSLAKQHVGVDVGRSDARWDGCVVTWGITVLTEGGEVAAEMAHNRHNTTVGQLKTIAHSLTMREASAMGTRIASTHTADIKKAHVVAINVALYRHDRCYPATPLTGHTASPGANGVSPAASTPEGAGGFVPTAPTEAAAAAYDAVAIAVMAAAVAAHTAAAAAALAAVPPVPDVKIDSPTHELPPPAQRTSAFATTLQASVEAKRQNLARLAVEQERENQNFAKLLENLTSVARDNSFRRLGGGANGAKPTKEAAKQGVGDENNDAGASPRLFQPESTHDALSLMSPSSPRGVRGRRISLSGSSRVLEDPGAASSASKPTVAAQSANKSQSLLLSDSRLTHSPPRRTLSGEWWPPRQSTTATVNADSSMPCSMGHGSPLSPAYNPNYHYRKASSSEESGD